MKHLDRLTLRLTLTGSLPTLAPQFVHLIVDELAFSTKNILLLEHFKSPDIPRLRKPAASHSADRFAQVSVQLQLFGWCIRTCEFRED